MGTLSGAPVWLVVVGSRSSAVRANDQTMRLRGWRLVNVGPRNPYCRTVDKHVANVTAFNVVTTWLRMPATQGTATMCRGGAKNTESAVNIAQL